MCYIGIYIFFLPASHRRHDSYELAAAAAGSGGLGTVGKRKRPQLTPAPRLRRIRRKGEGRERFGVQANAVVGLPPTKHKAMPGRARRALRR